MHVRRPYAFGHDRSLTGNGAAALDALTLAGTTAVCTIVTLFAGAAALNQDDVLAG
jgi:hypothetical protein